MLYSKYIFKPLRNCKLFSKVAAPFMFLLAMYEGSSFSLFSTTLAIMSFFIIATRCGCNVISHCDFKLHFLNDQ